MTLVSLYNSEGCVGRCDAKCYNAARPGCTCICGGKNHGVGLRTALDNAREHFRRWLEEAEKAAGEQLRGTVNPEVLQPSLPFGQ